MLEEIYNVLLEKGSKQMPNKIKMAAIIIRKLSDPNISMFSQLNLPWF